jgi:Resolvase, N terminal domain
MDQIELAKLLKRAAGTALALPKASQSRIRRVMVYARASTKRQDMSVGDQKKVLDVYIAGQKNWECVGVLEEVEKGKRRRKRTQYQLVKQAMRDRTVDIVLVHEMSRLGRNFSELIRFLELAEQNGVELHTARGPVAYAAAVALALVADLQIGATKDQIKRAHFSITMDGLHIGTPPYGYRCAEVDGRKGHLAVISISSTARRRRSAGAARISPPMRSRC